MPAWLIALGSPLAKWAIEKGKDLALEYYRDAISDLGKKDLVKMAEELAALKIEIKAYDSPEDIPKDLLNQYWAINEKLTDF